MLYTKEERYQVKKSIYSNKISTSNSAVHPSQYLTLAVDAEEKRQLEEHMKVSIEDVQALLNIRCSSRIVEKTLKQCKNPSMKK